jgi:hypothetical protein
LAIPLVCNKEKEKQNPFHERNCLLFSNSVLFNDKVLFVMLFLNHFNAIKPKTSAYGCHRALC